MATFTMSVGSNKARSQYTETVTVSPSGSGYNVYHSFLSNGIGYGAEKTIEVPSHIDLSTITIKKVERSITDSGASGNASITPDNDTIKSRLIDGRRSITLTYAFEANVPPNYNEYVVGTVPSEGSYTRNSDYHNWQAGTFTVTYEPKGKVNGSISNSSIGTVSYSIFTDTLIGQETTRLVLTTTASVAIKSGSTIDLYVVGSNPEQKITYTLPAISKNASYVIDKSSFQLSDDMLAVLSAPGQMGIRATLINSSNTPITFSSVIENFIIASARPAPIVSDITINDNTMNSQNVPLLTAYNAFIKNRSEPVYTVTAVPDTSLSSDTVISNYLATVWLIDGGSQTAYTTITSTSNSITIPTNVLSNFVNKEIGVTVTVTDNYGASADITSANITVIDYNVPTASNYNVLRYMYDSITAQDVPSPLGDLLYLFANLSWDSVVNNISNNAYGLIEVTNSEVPSYYYSNTFEVSSNTGVYVFDSTNGKEVFHPNGANTYPVGYTYNIKLTFYDDLSGMANATVEMRYAMKGAPYFNVEKTGVAVGTISTGTIARPLFQVAYPAQFTHIESIDQFYGRPYDTGWVDQTIASTNKLESNTWVQCRRIGKIVNVRGLIVANSRFAAGNEETVSTLDTDFRPSGIVRFQAGAYSQLWTISINPTGTLQEHNGSGAAPSGDSTKSNRFNVTYFVD